MWKFIFPIFVLANIVRTSDPGDARQNEVNGDQGFAYSFSGNTQNPSAFPFGFPYFPAFNFNPLFPDYFDNLRRFNDELAANESSSEGTLSYSYSATANGGRAKSSASFLFPILESKESIGNQVNAASSFANPDIASRFSDGNGGAASASGYVGNGQVRQKASVYPQNPDVPNINSRFGSDTGNEGSYGVFTSSFSETLPDKNGKPVTRQKASTTVNDNGKIRSYSVHNP